MEDRSVLLNGSSLDCLGAETVGAFHGNGFCTVNDDPVYSADHEMAKQQHLFRELFPIYLKENSSTGIVRPVPVLLGDGQLVDLYKLFTVVKERGGCAVVSRKGLWGYVAQDLGLNLEVSPSVKLVYHRYLNEFEGWLRRTYEERKFENGDHGGDWGFNSLPLDLEKEFRGLLSSNPKEEETELVPLESDKIMKYIDLVNDKSDTHMSDAENENKCEGFQHVDGNGDAKLCNGGGEDGPSTLDSENAEKEFNSRKRKREEFSGMLNWIKNIGKRLLDPLPQPIPKPSKLKEYKGQDFFGLTLRAREALLVHKHEEPNSESSSLQKQKMHPNMYEDHAAEDHAAGDHVARGHQGTMALRSSKRLTSGKKYRCPSCNSWIMCTSDNSHECPCCNFLSVCPLKKIDEAPLKKTGEAPLKNSDKAPLKKTGRASLKKFGNARPKRTDKAYGAYFIQRQAELPQWTGKVSESDDTKWSGTRVWPSKHDAKPATETDLIGRGRQENCSCKIPGSVDCIRFHIAENKIKLNREVGFAAYYRWGFNCMGEEVCLQWTPEEEKRFKAIMRHKPSFIDKFWAVDNVSKHFRKKTRRDAVDYFFNVFILQLRSYQNRVTPEEIDSDDEEGFEFGSFTGFGMEAVKGPGDDFTECLENKQCFDFESVENKPCSNLECVDNKECSDMECVDNKECSDMECVDNKECSEEQMKLSL